MIFLDDCLYIEYSHPEHYKICAILVGRWMVQGDAGLLMSDSIGIFNEDSNDQHHNAL